MASYGFIVGGVDCIDGGYAQTGLHLLFRQNILCMSRGEFASDVNDSLTFCLFCICIFPRPKEGHFVPEILSSISPNYIVVNKNDTK